MKKNNLLEALKPVYTGLFLGSLTMLVHYRSHTVICSIIVPIILLSMGGLVMLIIEPYFNDLQSNEDVSLIDRLRYQWKSIEKSYKAHSIYFLLICLLCIVLVVLIMYTQTK